MKDILNKLLPAKQKQGGALPKYSAKKRNKLITVGILSAVAVTAGVYLFITFNPLKSSVTSLAETPEMAFTQLHKQIKAGNRKAIIARMSRSFKGGVTKKREVIKAFEGLKGTNYTIKRDSSVSKGDIHLFTYTLSVNEKSVTLSDETWQKNSEENKWYLLKEGTNLAQIASLVSGSQPTGEAAKPAGTQAYYEVEKTIPEGSSFLLSIKNLDKNFKELQKTAFYNELTKIIKKKDVTGAELTLIETAITTLFGENVIYTRFGNSNNYLAVSKVSGPVQVLAPVVEKVVKFTDKNTKITSSPFGNSTIKTVVSGKNKSFYAFSKGFLHISDSELLLKNSLQLAEKKKEGSILNNTEVFTFLTDLRSDYIYYLLGSASSDTSPDYFNYGYLVGNSLKTVTTTSKEAKDKIAQGFITDNKDTFDGSEQLFDILPKDKYGFLAFSLNLATKDKAGNDISKGFQDVTGLKIEDTFTSKIAVSVLSGPGKTINDFFFPVVIAETKANMAEKALKSIADKFNLVINNQDGIQYTTFNLMPKVELVFSAVQNNLAVSLGMPGMKKVMATFSKNHPAVKSGPQWSSFFGDKTTSKILYSLDFDELIKTVTEVYARSNVNLLQGQRITKLESLDVLYLLGAFQNFSGKSRMAEGSLIDHGTLVFGDINPARLRAETKVYMQKSDLDLKGVFASVMSLKSSLFSSGTSTGVSTGIVPERKIEGFVYVSRKKRDPFAPSYMISQLDYEKELQNRRAAESLSKEMELESIKLEEEFLKPIVFDTLLLDLVKLNEPEEYQKIVKYAKLFKTGDSINLDTFEKRKKAIFEYNDLFTALKNKYEEDYLDKNKLPHHAIKFLELKGVATGALGSKALIVAGDRGFFIAEGDYISSEFFHVEQISHDNIRLMKRSFNYKLAPTSQEHILSISK